MNTRHTDVRMQQRGIPPLIRDWLLQYGKESHDHHGAIIRYFDKEAVRSLRRQVGSAPVCRMAEFMNAYLVERNGVIVTVGHRSKRFRRP